MIARARFPADTGERVVSNGIKATVDTEDSIEDSIALSWQNLGLWKLQLSSLA
jgi:hypothetical protein